MGGSLKYEEIINATQGDEKYQNIKNFVETGTYKGDTTLMASDYYDKVFTMEIVPELHYNSKLRAEKAGKTNINFYLGDSVKLLQQIVPLVQDGSVFFIDAHQSGFDTSNNGKQVPLMDELKVLLSTRLGPSLFIFDDVRFWVNHDQAAWDWTDVSEQGIIRTFTEKGYAVDKFFVHNDRFFVLARAIVHEPTFLKSIF